MSNEATITGSPNDGGPVQESATKEKVKLGYRVRTRRHGHVGVVCAIHHNFYRTGESEEWFEMQRDIGESAKFERWISVLNDGGGSVCVPESDVAEITSTSPVDNGNPWYGYYFHEE